MKKNKEYWLKVYSHPERYASEVAEEYKIYGSLLSIIREVKKIAKGRLI